MLRVNLIGPGDIEFHYLKLLKISKNEFNKHAEKIAKILAASAEIVLLPDRGISFEVARKYKRLKGRRIYATVPVSDKDFGIKHLMPYMNAKIGGKKIIDKIIDTQNWYKQDLTHCLYGDIVLMLGNSLGALGELVYGYYLYKLFIGAKPEVKVIKKKIHPEIRAGDKIPFSVIVYMPFMKGKLSYEIEAYIKSLKGKVYYVKNAEELNKILRKLGSVF